ncbi:MAG: hypothetical protein JRJ45_06990 [Deltaproteobacteria bacterium]|nr:hypothetical protein [Deltaproteobacteria bacterium]
MKKSKEFTVEIGTVGVAVSGKISLGMLTALLGEWEDDSNPMELDMELAQKLGAVVAIPWNEESRKEWLREIEENKSNDGGSVTPVRPLNIK